MHKLYQGIRIRSRESYIVYLKVLIPPTNNQVSVRTFSPLSRQYLRTPSILITSFLPSKKFFASFIFMVNTCGVVLTVQTHSSLRVAHVWVSVTLTRYTCHVRASIWRDTCIPTGALFTKLSFVLYGAWTILNVQSTFRPRNYIAPKK